MKRRIAIIGVAALIVALGLWLAFRDGGDDDPLSASGTVEATEADVGFQVGGRITEIVPREGDMVRRGQVLAKLDAGELDARRSAAEAQLTSARAQLSELQRGARPEELAQARAAAEGAAQKLREASRALERSRVLYEGGAVSREQLDQSETAYAMARSQSRQADEQLQIVQQGPRVEKIQAQQGIVRAAEAQVAQAGATLSYATIVAPFDGVVTVRHREPGEIIAPGLPVVTVMNGGDRWVRIYVREDRIGQVAIGQSARIRSDSHPGKTYPGRVVYISDEAEFTPRNVQTEEERVKLVYAVKVAITGDPRFELKPGVPADVTLTPRPAGSARR